MMTRMLGLLSLIGVALSLMSGARLALGVYRRWRMTRRLLCALLIVGCGWPLPTQATVVYSQNFDSFTVGDECTEMLAGDSNMTGCRYDSDAVTPPDISYLQVASSIPGYSGSLPSGSRILKSRVYTSTVQGDVDIAIGDSSSAAYNGYIPADVWFQVALYINNTSGEVTNITANRPMKFWYPCTNGAYPCQSGGSYNYFLLQTIKNTSGAPLCDTSLNSVTDGSMYLFLRDNDPTNSSPVWAGNGPVCGLPDNYLGQTNISEYIRPGRWNIIKVHANFTSASGANFEAWIAPMGGSFTKVMNWISGTTIEGYDFDWTYSAGDGSHRAVALLTSHPVNVSTGVDSYMYLDDYYVATSEGDLPIYSEVSQSGGTLTLSRTYFAEIASWIEVIASGLHLSVVVGWAWYKRTSVKTYWWAWRYKRAVTRWQREAPLMLAAPLEAMTADRQHEKVTSWPLP